MYLQGLISRDCEAMSSEDHAKWKASPEGIEHLRKTALRKAAFDAGDMMMLNMSGDRREDGFSLKIVEACREHVLAHICNGWNFDATTVAWAMEYFD
jgi:hypothetical protein